MVAARVDNQVGTYIFILKQDRKDSIIEFAGRLAFYLKAYGMIDEDLGKAIGTTTADAANIIEGRRGIRIRKAEHIANVFGVTYLEMINPEYPLPAVEKLPTYT